MTTTTTTPNFSMFMLGVLFWIGATMAYQDMLGLDGYIAAVNQGWVDTPMWIGIVIASLALIGALYPWDTTPERPTRPELTVGAWVRPRGSQCVMRISAMHETEQGQSWDASGSVIPPGASISLEDLAEIRTVDGHVWMHESELWQEEE